MRTLRDFATFASYSDARPGLLASDPTTASPKMSKGPTSPLRRRRIPSSDSAARNHKASRPAITRRYGSSRRGAQREPRICGAG